MFKTDKDTLIQFDAVNFGYEPSKPILQNVSFSIEKNQYVCIVGANGCGKSTIAKMIVGLFKPSNGAIYFENQKLTKDNVKCLKQSTGIILENPDNQFIGLTVQDDIAFGLENQCVAREKMQPIIDEVAKYVGITDILKSGTKDLSGGQKQLVAIASILAMNPKLIVFDEVTSMLDQESKDRVNQLICALKTQKNKTVVVITHDMEEVCKADKVIVLDKGKVALVGKPSEIFSNPKLKQLSLDKPFAYKLADQLGIKATSIDEVVNEVNYGK